MNAKEFIKKWNVAYEDKEQELEFSLEMEADLQAYLKAKETETWNTAIDAKWIPCGEKLPELLEYVLVYNTEGATLIARRFTSDWKALFSDGEKYMGELHPTHWMPLPEPPQSILNLKK